jgi:hypothetical protein
MILKKQLMKKMGTAVLASSLMMCMGTSVMAAPKSTETLTTGRTEQNRATGVISPNPVPTLAHYATDVVLTGTVVIDGPQLVLLVNGSIVPAILTKIADKTWTYQYKTTVGSQTGDVAFKVDAYTIYTNGKPAQDIHTRAASPVSQSVHVPYIESYDYTNLEWTSYDRAVNQFTFSYNQVSVWDDGVREVGQDVLTSQVNGTETYLDPKSGKTITPPTVFRDFTFSEEAPVWTYNSANNTYSVQFVVNKTWSNGDTASETISRSDLTPGAANDVSVTIEDVTHNTSLVAPAAPVKEVIVSVPVGINNVTFYASQQGQQQWQITSQYTVVYTNSQDNVTLTQTHGNVTNNANSNNPNAKTITLTAGNISVTYLVSVVPSTGAITWVQK